MHRETEITFMQTRLIRLASEEWQLPVEQVIYNWNLPGSFEDKLEYLEFECYTLLVNWKSKYIKRKGKDWQILTFSNF